MKKIFGLVLLMVSINSLAQNPTNYQYRTVRERMIALMIDSSLHIPRYCGAPSGLRVGSSVQDGALAVDTCNNILYYYSSATWYAVGTTNIYNTSGILTADRTLTGLNNTYSIHLDSLKDFRVGRNGIDRFYFNSTTSFMTSQNQNATVTVNSANAFMNYQANAFRVFSDSMTATKWISYETNINGSLTPNALTTKGYVDSVVAAGGGGSPGGSNKQVQYNNSGAFGGYTGFEVGNTNNDVLITAGATTSVPLNIKLASSQTAHAFDISSSAGTGDLSYFTKDGYLKVPAGTSSVPSIQVGSSNTGLYEEAGTTSLGIYSSGTGRAVIGQYGLFLRDGSNMVFDMGNNGLLGGTNYWRLSAPAVGTMQLGMESAQQSMIFKGANNAGTNAAGFNMTIQPGAGTGTSTSAGNVVIQTPDAHGSDAVAQSYTTKFEFNRLGFLEMKEISAPGTATSGYARAYVKSDGLWYGKDDAGVETMLSNAGGTTRLDQLLAATATNTINNADYTQEWQWNTLSASGLKLTSTSTDAASNIQRLLDIQLNGANSNSSQSTKAIRAINSHTGTSSTNYGIDGNANSGETNYGVIGSASGGSVNYGLSGQVADNSSFANYGAFLTASGTSTNNYGLYAQASGATNNYAIVVPTGSGNVGFGTGSPSSKAILDLSSTTQGLLLPRMTKTQRDAISSPPAGLAIYQTDNTPGLRVYNGTNWMRYTETAD